MDIKFQADTKMADSKRELEMQKATFNQEVNTKVLGSYVVLNIQNITHVVCCLVK